MRIAIVGTGGVGAGYGAALAKAGADVTFIARGAHLAAMKRDGLKVQSPRGDIHPCRHRRPTIPPRSARSISCCSASSCGTSKAPGSASSR
nr:2-dehydropantoate 2-reductase N-terminal domain-containing protein [Bradyrhizobium sp. AUGA SZCCT0169]